MRLILFMFIVFGGSYVAAQCFHGCNESLWSGVKTVVVWLATSKLAVTIAEWESKG